MRIGAHDPSGGAAEDFRPNRPRDAAVWHVRRIGGRGQTRRDVVPGRELPATRLGATLPGRALPDGALTGAPRPASRDRAGPIAAEDTP